ncbi:dual specificity protein phosphatase family protein [Sulfurimonas sp. HSL-1716]|uniref:dual specificity protein phosphatase family protein n=1 Tax=Hydrocurvibacter sulfurireducens TaxID=3131937 RepID=UPI0031F9E1FC
MKKLLKLLGLAVVIIGVYYVWHVNFNYRFEEISKDKVYKSALINPDKLGSYLKEYKIKTVIDLLDPGVQDRLNPGKQAHIDAEAAAVKKYDEENNANVVHVNIPSGQVPTKETLSKFFSVLDNNASYPVLIHCYHGTGRAQIYSAIYRIEYEKWKNADARAKTRFLVQGFGYRSSFADGKSKGDFLMHYKPRRVGEEATINQLNK